MSEQGESRKVVLRLPDVGGYGVFIAQMRSAADEAFDRALARLQCSGSEPVEVLSAVDTCRKVPS